MGRFKSFLGVTQLNVDGENLDLNLRLWDKTQLMEAMNMKDNLVRVQRISEIVTKVIQRSYLKPYHFVVDDQGKIIEDKPYERNEFQTEEEWNKYKDEKNEISAFVDKKCDAVLSSLFILWGWTTKKELDDSFRKQGIDTKTKETTDTQGS
jgi:hypothetical protein